MISVIADENGGSLNKCQRLPTDDIIIPSNVSISLFEDMRKNENHALNLPTHQDKWPERFCIVRIVNGKVLFGEIRYGENYEPVIYKRKIFSRALQEMLNKKQTYPIGFQSHAGMFNAMKLVQQIQNDRELRSFIDLFNLTKINMAALHTESFEDDCIVVTKDLIEAGFNCYYPCYYSDMKEYISGESMRSQLFAGDAIIVRKKNDGTLWHHKFIKDEFDLLYQLKK
jgi:hypothetical protein